jgi:GTPase
MLKLREIFHTTKKMQTAALLFCIFIIFELLANEIVSLLILPGKTCISRTGNYASGSKEAAFDEAFIFVRGGSGGHGANSFRLGRNKQRLFPNGGSGGDGGSVFLVGSKDRHTLIQFSRKRSFSAENGENGAANFQNGRRGTNTYVEVPIGTMIVLNGTSDVVGIINSTDSKVLVAEGGHGGKGNAGEKFQVDKKLCLPPQSGEKKWLRLELQLIADVGLIGVPNAGKSTLLKAITNAKPKIADYPFTTIIPNLGVCYLKDEDRMILADIPGLIEDAHKGKGLGRDFLRHVEHCKILIHVLDMTSTEPTRDYLTTNQELISHSRSLAEKPQIVVMNKIDQVSEQKVQQCLLELERVVPHRRILSISGFACIGLEDLKDKTWTFLEKVNQKNAS